MKVFFILLLMVNISLFANDEDMFDDFEDEFTTKVEKNSDPLAGYNEKMTHYNDIFYTNVLFPVANAYKSVVSEDVRVCISNFFQNIKFPIRFINNLAQLKFKNTLEESERFVINTTIGLGGLFDVASKSFDIDEHKEDFGQTLGFYGVGGGWHIVLPFLGPSNVRDSLSLLVDVQLDPLYYLGNKEYLGVETIHHTNEASFKEKEYESLKKDAIQLYPYLKDIYEQHRESEIKR